MPGGYSPVLVTCVCDDDARTFEFRETGDSPDVVGRVSAAMATGRRVRCYTLAAGHGAEHEEQRLVAMGYRWAIVKL